MNAKTKIHNSRKVIFLLTIIDHTLTKVQPSKFASPADTKKYMVRDCLAADNKEICRKSAKFDLVMETERFH